MAAPFLNRKKAGTISCFLKEERTAAVSETPPSRGAKLPSVVAPPSPHTGFVLRLKQTGCILVEDGPNRIQTALLPLQGFHRRWVCFSHSSFIHLGPFLTFLSCALLCSASCLLFPDCKPLKDSEKMGRFPPPSSVLRKPVPLVPPALGLLRNRLITALHYCRRPSSLLPFLLLHLRQGSQRLTAKREGKRRHFHSSLDQNRDINM